MHIQYILTFEKNSELRRVEFAQACLQFGMASQVSSVTHGPPVLFYFRLIDPDQNKFINVSCFILNVPFLL